MRQAIIAIALLIVPECLLGAALRRMVTNHFSLPALPPPGLSRNYCDSAEATYRKRSGWR